MTPFDVWYSKPRIFQTVGHWRCQSFAPDEWIATGIGKTPELAYEDMKRIIYGRYALPRELGEAE